MPQQDAEGVEPDAEPLGGGAGDQQQDTERAGSPVPEPADSGVNDESGERGGGRAPELAEDEDLAARLSVDPERGDVKG